MAMHQDRLSHGILNIHNYPVTRYPKQRLSIALNRHLHDRIFVQNRKELTTKIIQVDNEKIIQNTTGKKSRIYLSVNDILLNFDTAAFAISKEAYMGEDNKWENRWKEIATNKYDHLYFDDNIGSFLVQVEIRKSK